MTSKYKPFLQSGRIRKKKKKEKKRKMLAPGFMLPHKLGC